MTWDVPDREKAEELLDWAEELNPGKWAAHSRMVAHAAERIALACGMDAQKSYVLGLLHDIGRYEGVTDMHHIFAGYELMTKYGFDAAARICLTHSFPHGDAAALNESATQFSALEMDEMKRIMTSIEYEDFDRLIQLCDALGSAEGINILQTRMVDVTLRHNFDAYTLTKWKAFFGLKDYFDKMTGKNIYAIFKEEIGESIFG